MDPFSVLVVASNILRIIGLGEKIVSRVVDFRRLADAGLAVAAEFENLAPKIGHARDELKRDATDYKQYRIELSKSIPEPKILEHSKYSEQDVESDLVKEGELAWYESKKLFLKEPPSDSKRKAPKKPDHKPWEELLSLAKRCHEVAEDLINDLGRVKVVEQHVNLESANQVVESVWDPSRISSYSKQLSELRSQVCILIMQEFRERQTDFSNALSELLAGHIRVFGTITNGITELRHSIIELSSQLPSSSTIDGANTLLLFSVMRDLIGEIKRLLREKYILESLAFPSIQARQDQITQATETTFEWIFSKDDGSPTEFVDWMTSDEQLFWITGKAGSGKSTLMKFLIHDRRVSETLNRTGDASKIFISSYYFWNAGTALQKSQEGLFRSLLYQILGKLPHMIPSIVPEFWAQTGVPTWDYADLIGAFERLINQDMADVKFCFFIDGLDEFTGDIRRLLDMVNNMLTANIKLCVSSRPWNIFEMVWGSAPRLVLHDHNKSDIRKFINKEFLGLQSLTSTRLSGASRYNGFDSQSPGDSYENLISEIIERSSGVFLWVYLVVNLLRKDFAKGDTVADFQRRLRMVPTEMEAFLRQILEKTNRDYLSQASRLYQMCLAASEPVSLLTLAFYNELENDEDFAYLLPATEANVDFLSAKCAQTRKRVLARCQDLVEFVLAGPSDIAGNLQVVFRHRTVRDFLVTPDIDELLRRWSGEFDANLTLSKLLLLNLKIILPVYQQPMRDLATELFHQVRILELRAGEAPRKLMEEIAMLAKSSRLPGFISKDHDPRQFLKFSIEHGLCFFVRENPSDVKFLIETDGNTGLDPPLLAVLFDRSKSFLKAVDRENSFCTRHIYKEMVGALLELGANPNQIIPQQKGVSEDVVEASIIDVFYSGIWENAKKVTKDIKASWAEAMELLILHGGNATTMRFEDVMFTTEGATCLRALQEHSRNRQIPYWTQAKSRGVVPDWENLAFKITRRSDIVPEKKNVWPKFLQK